MQTVLLSFSLLVFASQARATPPPQVKLPPLEPARIATVAVDPDETEIPCDQLLARLERYNEMARQNDAAFASFLSDVVGRVGDWYSVLSPLEGSAQTLPAGTFSVLQSGGEEIAEVAGKASDNGGLLAVEMDKIIGAYSRCHP